MGTQRLKYVHQDSTHQLCVTVCVCGGGGHLVKRGCVKLGFWDLWELPDHMWTIYPRPRTSL